MSWEEWKNYSWKQIVRAGRRNAFLRTGILSVVAVCLFLYHLFRYITFVPVRKYACVICAGMLVLNCVQQPANVRAEEYMADAETDCKADAEERLFRPDIKVTGPQEPIVEGYQTEVEYQVEVCNPSENMDLTEVRVSAGWSDIYMLVTKDETVEGEAAKGEPVEDGAAKGEPVEDELEDERFLVYRPPVELPSEEDSFEQGEAEMVCLPAGGCLRYIVCIPTGLAAGEYTETFSFVARELELPAEISFSVIVSAGDDAGNESEKEPSGDDAGNESEKEPSGDDAGNESEKEPSGDGAQNDLEQESGSGGIGTGSAAGGEFEEASGADAGGSAIEKTEGAGAGSEPEEGEDPEETDAGRSDVTEEDSEDGPEEETEEDSEDESEEDLGAEEGITKDKNGIKVVEANEPEPYLPSLEIISREGGYYMGKTFFTMSTAVIGLKVNSDSVMSLYCEMNGVSQELSITDGYASFELPDVYNGTVRFYVLDWDGKVTDELTEYVIAEKEVPVLDYENVEPSSDGVGKIRINVREKGKIISGLNEMQCLVDGVPYTDYTASVFGRTVLCSGEEVLSGVSFDIDLQDEAIHTIEVVAADNAGNVLDKEFRVHAAPMDVVSVTLPTNFGMTIFPYASNGNIWGEDIVIANQSEFPVEVTLDSTWVRIDHTQPENQIVTSTVKVGNRADDPIDLMDTAIEVTKDAKLNLVLKKYGMADSIIDLQEGDGAPGDCFILDPHNADTDAQALQDDKSEKSVMSSDYAIIHVRGTISEGSEYMWKDGDITVSLTFTFKKKEETQEEALGL